MIEMIKKLFGPTYQRTWITECPWCSGDVEFINISPIRCAECKRILPPLSNLIKQKKDRIRHYKTSKPQDLIDENS